MIEQALPVALALMRRFEGFYPRPYMCPAGVPTIGYGSTYYEDGKRVTLTDATITRERAEALLLWVVAHVYLPQVIKLCPGIDGPDRLAALIDFTYNLGGNALKNSTLRRKINAGEWDAVPDQLRRWDKAGGRVLRGLTIRRNAEAGLI
jgi:lysozyme